MLKLQGSNTFVTTPASTTPPQSHYIKESKPKPSGLIGSWLPFLAGSTVGLIGGHSHGKAQARSSRKAGLVSSPVIIQSSEDISKYEGRWSVDFDAGSLSGQFIAFDVVKDNDRLEANIFQGNTPEMDDAQVHLERRKEGLQITINQDPNTPISTRIKIHDEKNLLESGISYASIWEKGSCVGEATVRKIM